MKFLNLWGKLSPEEKNEFRRSLTLDDLQKFRNSPLSFAKLLDIEFTEDQIKIIKQVTVNSITNVRAAHGVGKSFVGAFLVIWWVFCRRKLAISTAPTETQIKQILWAEIKKILRKYDYLLKCKSKGELFFKIDEFARAYGFTGKSYDPNSFQGKHDSELFILADEADGISEVIDDSFRSCVVGAENRALRMGNPISKNSAFAKACSNDSNLITIPVWNHPNVNWAYKKYNLKDGTKIHRLKPEIKGQIIKVLDYQFYQVLPQNKWPQNFPRDKIPGAVSINWIEEIRRDKGEFSNYWLTRVEALLPEDDLEGLIPRNWLISAQETFLSNQTFFEYKFKNYPIKFGVDVADQGNDSHCLAIWYGPILLCIEKFHSYNRQKNDLINFSDYILKQIYNYGFNNVTVYVDSIGVGAGVYHYLKHKGVRIKDVKFHEQSDFEQYKNIKAELYWYFREGIRKNELFLNDFGDLNEEFYDDFSLQRYFINKNNEIEIESKDEFRKRYKRSPDIGDAVVIGLYEGIKSKDSLNYFLPIYTISEEFTPLF